MSVTIDRIAKTINGPNVSTHIGEEKLRELQDVRWGQIKSQEQLNLHRQAAYVLVLFEQHVYESGYVVCTAEETQFRFIDDYGAVVWTEDLEKALTFSRRQDAEAFAKDDEDAWKILKVADILAGRRGTLPGRTPSEAPAQTQDPKQDAAPMCLPVDRAEDLDVLRIFRQFVNLNATQWQMGTNHHPMWAWLTERIDKEENHQGPDWAFIQPTNRKRHAVLTEEYVDLINSREAEERGG